MRKFSVSPTTGKKYQLPGQKPNRAEIDEFVVRNSPRIPIVVQGLGFVGAITALVCSNTRAAEYAVIGVDLATPSSYWRVAAMREGIFPISAEDPEIYKLFRASTKRGNLLATHQEYAYSLAEVIIIDVNLDVKNVRPSGTKAWTFAPELSGFEEAITTVAQNCREDALVIVETTVPPGTCEKIVYPILRSGLLERGLAPDRIKLGHSYERITPGPEYVSSITQLPRVYSGIDEESADATEAFLASILGGLDAQLCRLPSTTSSEMAKVLENSYRATNIAFIDEWTRFAEAAGVNLVEIIDAIRVRSTHSNLMYPGIGIGGYCLTKDPLLASWSSKEFFGLEEAMPAIKNAVRTGQLMPEHAFQSLKSRAGDLSGKKLLLLGVSYRGGVADTRNSPALQFMERAIFEGMKVSAHDPIVSYWPEAKLRVFDSLDTAFDENPDVIAVTARHSVYGTKELVSKLITLKSCFIFDSVNAFSSEAIALLSKVHTIRVLGRGDL